MQPRTRIPNDAFVVTPSQVIRKIDAQRYVLLYLFGGVYLDADDARVSGGGAARARAPRVAVTPPAVATIA